MEFNQDLLTKCIEEDMKKPIIIPADINYNEYTETEIYEQLINQGKPLNIHKYCLVMELKKRLEKLNGEEIYLNKEIKRVEELLQEVDEEKDELENENEKLKLKCRAVNGKFDCNNCGDRPAHKHSKYTLYDKTEYWYYLCDECEEEQKILTDMTDDEYYDKNRFIFKRNGEYAG